MPGLIRKSLDDPEEVRPFQDGTGRLELVNLDGGAVGRATFQAGWRWSEHVKPIAKTDSCQAAHTCYFVSGRMKVVTEDGEEMEYGPGDFAVMAPGHDAWIFRGRAVRGHRLARLRRLRQTGGALRVGDGHLRFGARRLPRVVVLGSAVSRGRRPRPPRPDCRPTHRRP